MSDMNTVVAWTEIPVTDLEAAVTFYNESFGWNSQISTDGPNDLAFFDNRTDTVAGHLYPGKPAQDGRGSTVYLNVPDTVEATGERVAANGGVMMGPIIDMPFGRFQYCTDPDGNSLALFQAAAA